MPANWQITPEALAEACGWKLKIDGGDLLVRPLRHEPLELEKLADSTNADKAGAYARIASWKPQDNYEKLWTDVAKYLEPRLAAELSEARWWEGFQLVVTTAPDAEVRERVQNLFTHRVLPELPTASLWSVRIDPWMKSRATLSRSMVAARDVQTTRGDYEQLRKARFLSAGSLVQDTMLTLNCYITPFLLAASPWILGVVSARTGGVIILLFGSPQPGHLNTSAPELVSLFRPTGITKRSLEYPTKPPTIDARSSRELMTWWIERLNALFEIILDPRYFVDADGWYQPGSQFGAIVSIERLFANVQAVMSTVYRHDYIGVAMLFDALDTLDGLGYPGYDNALNPKRVRDRAKALLAAIPEDVSPILEPRFDEAVRALDAVAQGFAPTLVSGSNVRLRSKDGASVEEIPLDAATAQYLRVVRNSAHSYRKVFADNRRTALMAAHTGEIPAQIAQVSFVHALQVLVSPDVLAMPLSRSLASQHLGPWA